MQTEQDSNVGLINPFPKKATQIKDLTREERENIQDDLALLEQSVGAMVDELERKWPTIGIALTSRICTKETKYNEKKGGSVQAAYINFPEKNSDVKITWWDF